MLTGQQNQNHIFSPLFEGFWACLRENGLDRYSNFASRFEFIFFFEGLEKRSQSHSKTFWRLVILRMHFFHGPTKKHYYIQSVALSFPNLQPHISVLPVTKSVISLGLVLEAYCEFVLISIQSILLFARVLKQVHISSNNELLRRYVHVFMELRMIFVK